MTNSDLTALKAKLDLVALTFAVGTSTRTVEDENWDTKEVEVPALFAQEGHFHFRAEEWNDPENGMVGWTWNVYLEAMQGETPILYEVRGTDIPTSREEAEHDLMICAALLRKTQLPGRMPCFDCRGTGLHSPMWDEGPCKSCGGEGYLLVAEVC